MTVIHFFMPADPAARQRTRRKNRLGHIEIGEKRKSGAIHLQVVRKYLLCTVECCKSVIEPGAEIRGQRRQDIEQYKIGHGRSYQEIDRTKPGNGEQSDKYQICSKIERKYQRSEHYDKILFETAEINECIN